MNIKLSTVFLFSLVVCLFSGCSEENLDNSELPWATPATWEGRLPGFGAGSGY